MKSSRDVITEGLAELQAQADRRAFAAFVIGMAGFLALLVCFGSDGASLRVRDLPSCSALAAGDWLPVDLFTPPTTCKATAAQLGSFLTAGTFSGVGSCTNQVVTGLNGGAAPTCANVTSAMVVGSVFPSTPAPQTLGNTYIDLTPISSGSVPNPAATHQRLYLDSTTGLSVKLSSGITHELDDALNPPTVEVALTGGGVSTATRLSPGTGVTTTDLGDGITEIAAAGSSTNSFKTIAPTSGTSPVASSSTDTLNLAAGYGITVTGNSGTKTITFAVVNPLNQDSTGSAAKLNGVALSGLATGILKNTTGTGAPSIAAAGDFPPLNQSTTGTAAGLSTTLPVTSGGTGLTAITAHSVPVGNGTTAPTLVAPGAAGTVLTSNGASSDPSYQAVAPPNLLAFKASDEGRSLSTAYADDSEISVTLAASRRYSVDFHTQVTCDVAAGFRLRLIVAGATNALWFAKAFDSSGAMVDGEPSPALQMLGDGGYSIEIHGFIESGSGGILKLQWGQNVIGATATTLLQDTHLVATPL